jgi:hypothetical protein
MTRTWVDWVFFACVVVCIGDFFVYNALSLQICVWPIWEIRGSICEFLLENPPSPSDVVKDLILTTGSLILGSIMLAIIDLKGLVSDSRINTPNEAKDA